VPTVFPAYPCYASLLLASVLASAAVAQTSPPAAESATAAAIVGETLPIRSVRIVGNTTVPDSRVLNAIRMQPGGVFSRDVALQDVRRIEELRRFGRVVARYEVIDEQVNVVFEVEEKPAVDSVGFVGNEVVDDATLRRLVDREAGLAAGRRGDPVLLALAADAVERFYRSQNYALVDVRPRRDAATGEVVFDIVEGPRVRVRNIDFLGNESFSEGELKKQVQTKIWTVGGFLGLTGRYTPEQIEADVAALRTFYRDQMGFFDARIGRRLVWSPDRTQLQIEFLIEEGPRYRIGEINLEGLEDLPEADAEAALAERGIVPGAFYERERIERAVNDLVALYGPLGRIYDVRPPGIRPDPDFLRINPQPRFRREPGTVDIDFSISEGRPFKVGQVRVRGNDKTQDKVILRAFDLAPGEPYDSDAVRRAERRLGGLGYFSRVRITPIRPPADLPSFGLDDESTRDVLVEVEEQSTATIIFGGSVSTNGGIFGQIRYEQNNFDLFDLPTGFGDFFGGAFQGAGQRFRISLEPGTRRTSASVLFFEPYLLDQNLGLGVEGYFRTFRRREYRDARGGGRIWLVPRLGRNLSTTLTFRAEDVRIHDIDQPFSFRAPEILAAEGHTTLTSIGGQVAYTAIDNPLLPSQGFRLSSGWESFGVLGGPSFQRITAGANAFVPLYRDERDRPTVLDMRLDAGAIYNDAPFFERFYAGGFGSIRGFRFRGIGPRDGLANDPIGGNYSLTGSVGVGFPIAEDTLRGVVFTDFGSTSNDTSLGTIRVAAGAGLRLTFPALGNIPLAFDLAWPINRRDGDEESVFSFSLGILQ
jgi:outer membrane protein insertion porin family